MKSIGVVFPRPGETVLEPFELGKPGPGQVLIQAAYSSLSPGTERGLMSPEGFMPFPVTVGYSLAGTVAAVGPAVERLRVGDAVVTTGRHGSFILADERFCTPVPAGVDLEQACFFNLAHTAIYGVRRAEVRLGDPVMVLGQGLVGLLAARIAQMAGALPVVAVDLDEKRLDLSRRFGLALTVNGADQNAVDDVVGSLAGGGPAAIIEATGSRKAVEQALEWVRERGRIVMLSTYHGDETIDFHRKLSMKGASLVGAYINSKPFRLERSDVEITDWPPSLARAQNRYAGGDIWTSDSDIRVFLDLIRYGGLDLAPLITHRFRPEEVPAAYDLVLRQDPSLVGGVISWEAKP